MVSGTSRHLAKNLTRSSVSVHRRWIYVRCALLDPSLLHSQPQLSDGQFSPKWNLPNLIPMCHVLTSDYAKTPTEVTHALGNRVVHGLIVWTCWHMLEDFARCRQMRRIERAFHTANMWIRLHKEDTLGSGRSLWITLAQRMTWIWKRLASILWFRSYGHSLRRERVVCQVFTSSERYTYQ